MKEIFGHNSGGDIARHYFVNIDTKKRYINPLIKLNGETKRITLLSEKAQKTINDFLIYKDKAYGYIKLNIEPI